MIYWKHSVCCVTMWLCDKIGTGCEDISSVVIFFDKQTFIETFALKIMICLDDYNWFSFQKNLGYYNIYKKLLSCYCVAISRVILCAVFPQDFHSSNVFVYIYNRKISFNRFLFSYSSFYIFITLTAYLAIFGSNLIIVFHLRRLHFSRYS